MAENNTNPKTIDEKYLRQLEDWSGVEKEYPYDRSLGGLFQEEAERRAAAVAVVFEEQMVSYAELNRRSSQMAKYLRKKGVVRGTRVGMCVERSVEMIEVLLGIVKAGGVYVPLDGSYPRERLKFMVEDAGVEVLVVSKKMEGRISWEKRKVTLENEREEVGKESGETIEDECGGEDLAYIIYTSGSTGQPKGVSVCHRGVTRLVRNADYVVLGEEEVVLQFAPVSFDAATFEIWGALLNGAQLKVFPAYTPSVQELGEWLEREQVTTMWLTAGLFHQMVEQKMKGLRKVRQLLAGGDVLSRQHVRKFLREGGGRLINGYGPTENTTFSTCARLEEVEEWESVPIGKPVTNSQAYVLDEEMEAVEVGAVGELYLGGEGLARGYWGRADLTAEKFVPNPYGRKAGQRLYRSGDLGRWREDGNLEFIGRKDQQVKLRGYRIELGEIEKVLEQLQWVEQAVVALREEEGGKQLVAYVVEKEERGEGRKMRELRQHAEKKLPEYMVPSHFVRVEKLPLTANGKVDRKKLPAAGPAEAAEQDYEAPGTITEELLAGIWSEVLQAERVGVHDNFFHLGGHSLLATQIIARIKATFGITLSLRDLFAHPVLRSQAQYVERAHRREFKHLIPPLVAILRDQEIPLSFSQERVWFLQKLEPSNTAYHFQATLRLMGKLDVPALKCSLDAMVRQHEILRTTFTEKNRRPVQEIHEPWAVTLPVISFRHVEKNEQEAKIREFIEQELVQSFDVSQLPLIRWVLLCLDEDEHLLLDVEHHLIHDGWSFNVFLGELLEAYAAFSSGSVPAMPQPQVQFADYAVWQNHYVQSEIVQSQLSYWKNKLAGAASLTEFPTDRPRPHLQAFKGKVLRVGLIPELCRKVRNFSALKRTSLFVTMMAAYVSLVYRYTRQCDLCIGSTVANRQIPETERLLGMLVNNVVLRNQVSPGATFGDYLDSIRQLTFEAYDNQDVPFQTIVQSLPLERDLSVNPLFQMMFNFHSSPVSVTALPGLKLNLEEGLGNGSAKFDMGIIVIPSSSQRVRLNHEWTEDSIMMLWEYNTDLFDESTVLRLIGHYQALLQQMVLNPGQRVEEACLLSPQEEEQLLSEVNRTYFECPRDKCIHELFEEQVEQTPGNCAVRDPEKQMSYKELNARANQLARYLRQMGVMPEHRIGLCLARGVEILVGILGIFKAGAAYLPLDATYPIERLRYFIEDAGITLVITQSDLLKRLPAVGTPVICIDKELPEITRMNSENLRRCSALQNPAYVIYTSGSTGEPKGTMISIAALVNLLLGMKAQLEIKKNDVLVALTTLAFDIAVLELLLPLISGAMVIIESRQVAADGMLLAKKLDEYGATIMQGTPSTWRLLLEAGWKGRPRLMALCGGEPLTVDIAHGLLEKCGSLWNLYGPTETTVWSASYKIPDKSANISIGRPIGNTQIYLLDEGLQPVPIGMVGELYIAGDGLARGYLKRPHLTAERFIPNPFSHKGGERMYRTGDLMRWRQDMVLEFLGRADFQVKLRGHRIELGEIEATLASHPTVGCAVALVREDSPGDQRLVVYWTAKKKQDRDREIELKSYLQMRLPEYMVPSETFELDEMPLMPNGKLDRKSLLQLERYSSKASSVRPHTSAEKILCGIWSEVLHVPEIGVNENFFHLGGHSLLATQIIVRINESFSLDFPLRALFEHPTIVRFAAAIENAFVEKVHAMSDEEAERLLKASSIS